MKTRRKRIVSWLLLIVMSVTVVPLSVITSLGKTNEITPVIAELDNADNKSTTLNFETSPAVTALTELYGGDEEKAKADLEALYASGLIDADGNMVELDVKENGTSVDISSLANRIKSGENVSNITVNGNKVTADKIVQLQQVSSMLEIIQLADSDVNITNEHVTNLQTLLEEIADGSINLSNVISNGGKQISVSHSMGLRSANHSDTIPDNDGTGELETTDGTYKAPYISESEYEEEHTFTLIDSSNTTWYTENAVFDGVVTLSCEANASLSSTFTVTATLNKVQSVPVSFEWAAVSDVINLTDTTTGTVTWAAYDTNLQKSFDITIGAKTSNWYGSQCFVVNAGNIKNALFDGGKEVWSQTVQIITDSDNDKNAVSNEYPVDKYSYGFTSVNVGGINGIAYKWVLVDKMPKDGDRFIINFTWYAQDTSWMYIVDPTNFTTDATGFTNLKNNSGVNRYVIGYGRDGGNFPRPVTFTERNTELTSRVKNGQVYFVYQIDWQSSGYGAITGLDLTVPYVVAIDEVESVSAPSGTYSSGQIVPVTVKLKEHAVATEGTTLTVNGVQCPMLTNPNTEAKTFTFAYTVKETDTGALNVTELSDTFINGLGNKVNFESAFPPASIGADEGVILSSDVKTYSLDWDNVKYGIDDAGPGSQVVTVVIPFKADANKTWITNETLEFNTPVTISVPGYENAEAAGCLSSAYFSADGGKTRYPVYVLGDDADALAVRFTAPLNASSYLRQDNLYLYLDKEVGTTTEYFGTEHTDENGYTYFSATNSTALASMDKYVSYFVRASILFESTKTVGRVNFDESNIVLNEEDAPFGLYKYGDKYVVVLDGNYNQQHDVEICANEALYKALTQGIRAEDPNTLLLSCQFSDRKDFTFKDDKYFSWSTTDSKIAKVVKNKEYDAWQIILNGNGGEVTLTLNVENGAERNKYEIPFTITVLEGKSPFLSIPEFSKERTTLTEVDTDVLFTSNVTARNAALNKDATFTVKLYKVDEVNEVPTGEAIWTEDFVSTLEDTLTSITVPGKFIEEAGIYAVSIETKYEGGEVNGVLTEAEELSAMAYLNVKQAPLKVKLNELESYSVDYQNIPTIEYTIKPVNASDTAVVEYTIQKSGEAVSERKSASNGVIPFSVEKPTSLKDAYTITVYARSKDADENAPWSMDSMLLRVYNMDILDIIVKDVISGEIGGTTEGIGDGMNGSTITMDNHDKLENYGIIGDSYRLTVSDLNALRTDMSLQKIVSANYGSGIWGLLSDKMQWSSSNSDAISINYKQGGIYSDINNYSYTSYGPATDFLLVGKEDTDGVTITVTHAGTGKTASITVSANTLKDQLYIFQFFPKVETDVIYFTVDENGNEVKRTLKSDENGVLAVYEPNGIKGAVMAMSKVGNETYVGTIYASELESGERDIASLQLYPTNNLRLRSISNATLTFLNPDGSYYQGTVSLRVGVYKNGTYCPEAQMFLEGDSEGRNGREDIVVDVTDGTVTIGFNPMTFKIDPEDAEETGAYPGDKIAYVVEYRVGDYQTSYAIINAVTNIEGEHDPMDSVIQLKAVKGSSNGPQIIRQTMQQYTDDEPVPYTRNIIDYPENIGVSSKFNKVVVTTDFVLPSSTISTDGDGHSVLDGEFAFYTADGVKLTGQTEYGVSPEVTINKLSELEGSNLFIFPFSAAAFGHHVYTLTDENLKADGITDEGNNPTATARVKMMFVRNGMAVTSMNLPFGISNLSHAQDLTDENGAAKDVATDIKTELSSQMNIGNIFKSINVNDMLQKGFAFLGGLTSNGDSPMSLIIIPTENPGIFRIVAFVGSEPEDDDDGDGVSINYDPNSLYEDFNSLMEDDDDDDSGETSYEVNFSGTIVLEAGYDVSSKKWKVDFLGGSVGLGFSMKYEWSQNFFCGPIPANISFEVGAHANLKVSFANKSSVKQMLVDATIGVSIEAFAGIGFDASIAKLKLGIYGKIGADVNFLLLTDFKSASTGTKLTINGEIGIRLEVKILFIKYKKTLASTGFNWTKKWNSYDSILRKWEESGAAEIFGFTKSGRAYSMRLLANGTAIVAIDGGGELENRDYLELSERAWNSGVTTRRGLLKAQSSSTNSLTNIQTNAYPYSNPVFVDDGSMFLYISDNDNADALENVVSFAKYNGSGYTNEGALYDTTGVALGDSDVVASGAGNNIFAAWVKQNESPEKEMNDQTTSADLGMMMNATEVYAGSYDGASWTTTRLTDNKVADMAPTIASYGDKAIAAWRSLSATKMPENGGSEDFSTMFDAENNINFSIYDGTKWNDAKVAYNGSAGTVSAIDSAMLSDGTSILTYTVRTGSDVTSAETFYTVIDVNGNVVTTGRLTNDNYTDNNAQVSAVGNQFVVGWYSEHDTGEKTKDPDTGVEENVVAHDIRLARINANGSIDESFLESVGGSSAAGITSNFRFSAPVHNDDLNKLAIVWSQTQESGASNDGVYEINAMRFYENNGVIGMTTQINIVETEDNFTVDHFDTYTDGNGRVHVLVLGSDYNSLDGLAEYDTIDLSNQPIETSQGSELLTILEQNPIAYIKNGSNEFSEISIDVSVDTNLYELVPGLDLPVQFTIKNTGTGIVDKADVKFGDIVKSVEGLSLLPNQSTTISIVYSVPETEVKDVDYSITANDVTVVDGTMILNRPDVAISSMKITREENDERNIQVVLANKSGIPLDGSGKTVKLAFYSDQELSKQLGDIITIPEASYTNIDNGIFVYNQTFKIEDLIGDETEIPDKGIRVYAKSWIEEEDGTHVNEIYPNNNSNSVYFQGLLTRNNGQKISTDTYIEVLEGGYKVSTEIRNNSIQETNTGIPVVLLLDSDGNVIAQKSLLGENLVLKGEETASDLSVTFGDDEVNGTPATAIVLFSYTVTFEVCEGSGVIQSLHTDVYGHIELPEEQPVPPEADKTMYFKGWFSEPLEGEKITNEYTYLENTTIYAHYDYHHHHFAYIENGDDSVTAICVNYEDECDLEDHKVTLTINAPQRANEGVGNQNATISGIRELGENIEITYYTANVDGSRGDLLAAAPAGAGKYWAEFTVSGESNNLTAHVVYEIPEIKATYVSLPNFVKVTSIEELNNFQRSGANLMKIWVSNNSTLINADPKRSKIFVIAKDTLPFDPRTGDELEEETTFYVGFRGNTSDEILNVFNDFYLVSDIADIIASDTADVYIQGSEAEDFAVIAAFEMIDNPDDLSKLVNCSMLDAMIWIEAHKEELQAHFMEVYSHFPIVFSLSDGNYSYFNYIQGSIDYHITPVDWADFQYPLYVATGITPDPNATNTVSYDVNGGTGTIEDDVFYQGSEIFIRGGDGISKDNSTFIGWNTKADGSGHTYLEGDTFMVTQDITLYAQWKHTHSWTYSYDEEKNCYTAKCDVPGCTLGNQTLQVENDEHMYNGKTVIPYTLSEGWTKENGLIMPTITYYKNGELVSEAKDVGSYIAKVRVKGIESIESEFIVTPRPVRVYADDIEIHEGEENPELTVTYDSIGDKLYFENDATYPWQAVREGNRYYVKAGNSGKGSSTSTLTLNVTLEKAGTLSFDYMYGTENNSDYCYFRVDDTEKIKVSDLGDHWQSYACELSEGSHTLTWSYSKDFSVDANGDFFAIDNFEIITEGILTQEDHEIVDSTEIIEALNADLRFENDTNYPWKVVTEDDRTYVTSGNAEVNNSSSTLILDFTLDNYGTISFDYKYGTENGFDYGYFYLDGNELLKMTGVKDWTSYSHALSVGTHKLIWRYTKDNVSSDNGDFFAIDNVVVTTKGEIEQENPNVLFIRAVNKLEGGIVKGETLNYNITRQEGDVKGTYAISLEMGDNPNYEVKEVRDATFTILESQGDPQTIEVSDVVATYGDTGVNINASITEGDGTLSYVLKSGDAVSVDEEGNLTILKEGTAVITVIASQTAAYRKTTKSINITVNPKDMDVIAEDVEGVVNGQPYGITVTVNDPIEDYTVKYGVVEGTYNLSSSPVFTTAGTMVVYYQVTAENYVTYNGKATITLVEHAHELTYTLGTGDEANTIIAHCSGEDCTLPDNTATLSISAPANAITYDGAAHPAIITDKYNIKGDAKVVYQKKGVDGSYGEASEIAPVEVGTYLASITLGSGDNAKTISVEYSIVNATLTNVSVAQIGTLTYNGNAQVPQVTTNATSLNNQTVTFTYSLVEDGEYGAMPSFTDVNDGGTVYFKAVAPNHDEVFGSFQITINKANRAAPAEPTLDSASANTVKLVEVEGCEYSMDGINWQDETIFSNLDKSTEYTFYQRYKENANYKTSAARSTVISTTDHSHEWGGFVGAGNTITATCENSDGGHSNDLSATMTIVAPTRTIYGEGNAEATVINNIEGIATPTIVYKNGDVVLDAAPTNVGTYTAYITSNGVTASVTYTIAQRAITVTIVNKTSTYGDAQVELEATTEDGAIVNGDTGVYSLSSSVNEQSSVGTYDIIGTCLDNNYNITFVNEKDAYSVTKKALTVVANPHTITYGDQPNNNDVTYVGFVNDEDKSVLGGTLAFAYTYSQYGDVGDYVITPSGYSSDNYEITYENGVLTVARKRLTISANTNTITYGDEASNAGVTYEGFVGDEDEDVLVGTLTYDYSYSQYQDAGKYTITPSGYSSGNYEIIYQDGALTVTPKAITVTIVNKTSTYGDAQVKLEATTEDGAIVNGDTGVYSLSSSVNEQSSVGKYDIIGTCLDNNYNITFVNEKDAYSVTKRSISASAEDKTITSGQELPTYSFVVSEKIAQEVLDELKEKTTLTSNANSQVPGKYEITFSFVDGIDENSVLTNYTVTLENAYIYILTNVLTDNSSEDTSGVEILLENSDETFDYNISVEIEVVTTTESSGSSIDFSKVSSQYVDRRSEISKVYSIKLYRTDIVDGEEVAVEIQPSDIKDGLSIIVKMEIPEYLTGRNFRILHIHSENDIEYVDDSNVEVKDGYVYVKINRLSEFAFVNLKDNEEMNHSGFCLGWVVIILDILVAAFFVVYLLLKRKKLFNIIGLGVSGAVLVFGLVVLILHICYVSIIGFTIAAVLFALFLVFFFIKRNGGKVQKAEEKEELDENEKVEQPVDENIEEEHVVVDAKGNYFNIRYNKSFIAKLIQSDDELKGYYGKLKNEALSYQKTTSRISWSFDSINSGKNPVVKFGIRRKTLCLYFPLNVGELDEKYKVEEVDSKKYQKVPCMYRIKNERRFEYAKQLIEIVCSSLGLEKGEAQNEDYYLPFETTEALIEKKLIKEVVIKATTEQIDRAKEEGSISVVDSVSVSEANDLISDEIAESAIIEERKINHTGKRGVINIDTLSMNFESGETITIERLKEKKLIHNSIGQVKVLARGTLDKVLHVELQDYSIEAVKMILATGGTVKRS